MLCQKYSTVMEHGNLDANISSESVHSLCDSFGTENHYELIQLIHNGFQLIRFEGDSNFRKSTTPNLGGIILDIINCRLQQFIPVPLPGSFNSGFAT